MTMSLRLSEHRIANGLDPRTGLPPDGNRRIEAADVIAFRQRKADEAKARRAAWEAEDAKASLPAPALRKSAPAMAPKASAPAAPTLTGQHLHLAAEQARKAERDRWEKVFASEHSKGRERVCATLLTNSANWSAAAIIAELPGLPTDAARAARQRGTVSEASSKAWDNAYARTFGTQTTPTRASNDSWDRAYDRTFGAQAEPESASAQSVSGNAWDRAIARNWPSKTN